MSLDDYMRMRVTINIKVDIKSRLLRYEKTNNKH